MRVVALGLAALLFASRAVADAPPEPPRKDIPYSVQIDNIAEISNFAIVLYPWHEQPGAPLTLGVFAPNRELGIDPQAPAAQIFRVKSADLPSLRVEVDKAKSLDTALLAVKMKGTECGYPLPRHQQVLRTSTAIRMRVHYAVDTHLLCERKNVREETVEEAAAVPAASSPPPTTSAAPVSSAPSPGPSKGCGACDVGRARSTGSELPLLVLVAFAARRAGARSNARRPR